MFNLNQIVKGKVCGMFVIIAFRQIEGETYAQLKAINPLTQKALKGELSLPLTAIEAI